MLKNFNSVEILYKLQSIGISCTSLCLLLTCAILLYVSVSKRVEKTGKFKKIPKVDSTSIFGHSNRFVKENITFLRECNEKYGDIFKLRFYTFSLNIICARDGFKSLSQNKLLQFSPIRVKVQNNLFGSKSDTINAINSTVVVDIMKNHIDDLVNYSKLLDCDIKTFFNSHTKHDIEFNEFMKHTMFKSIFHNLFGTSTNLKEIEKQTPISFKYQTFYDNLNIFHKYFTMWIIGMPKWLHWATYRAMGQLKNFPKSNILLQRNVSLKIRKTTEIHIEHNSNENEIICSNLFILHVSNNVYMATLWAINHCFIDKKIQNDLYREILCEFDTSSRNNQNSEILVSIEKMDQLPLLDSFVYEIFRFYGTTFQIRKCKMDTDLKINNVRYQVNKDEYIAFYGPILYNNTKYFHDPK
ncbi:hypothetical protein A3Q56_07145, partial [Intoshia linei]